LFSSSGHDRKIKVVETELVLNYFSCAGVREKKVAFINVKVYAVALYVEPGVRAALASWRGQPASSLSKNCAFFNSVLAGKGLHVISKIVFSEKIIESFRIF
jgi:hypothetical protein